MLGRFSTILYIYTWTHVVIINYEQSRLNFIKTFYKVSFNFWFLHIMAMAMAYQCLWSVIILWRRISVMSTVRLLLCASNNKTPNQTITWEKETNFKDTLFHLHKTLLETYQRRLKCPWQLPSPNVFQKQLNLNILASLGSSLIKWEER